jgi:HEAT repeat protein/Flp pilus assembly protein TadD
MASENNILKEKGLYLLKPCTRKLIGFLSHQDPRLKEEGAKALEKICDPEAIIPLTEAILKEKQDSSMPEALAAIGDEISFRNLLTAFAEADKEIRPNIALALGNFKDKIAVDALVSGLSDLDANVRYASITSLGRIKDLNTVSNLLGCLGESNEWIFLNVVDALAKIGNHKATNPLVAFFLRERNERKRAAIISALGQLGDLTTVATLTRALRDPDDRVKANAIEAFSKLGLPSDKVFALIQPFFNYSSNRVRGNALVAAYKIGKVSELKSSIRSMTVDPSKWVRATAAYILSVIDCDNALEYLIELLKDDEPDVRKNAAKAFTVRAKEAQTGVILEMLNDTAPFVRLQAITMLGKLRVAPASDILVKMLSEERNPKLRASIITSLGHIGGKGANITLQSALHDRDSRVRANAVEGLEEILGEGCIRVIKPMLHDSDNRTKANAAKILFRLGETDVVKDLENMLSSRDLSLKISGAYAVRQLGIVLNELLNYPAHSLLAAKLEKIKLPTAPKIIRSAISESINSPVINRDYIPSSAVQTSKNTKTPLQPPERSNAEIREELRDNYQNFYKVGKLKEALEAVEYFLSKFPYDSKGLTFAGNLYFKLTRFENAIKTFNKILEMDPFSIQALSNLGTAYYRNGAIEEAIESYKKALKLKPDLSVIRFNLASIYLKTNRWQEAIKQYEDGLRYQQPSARILNNLALAYQKSNDFEKAAEIYRKVIVLDSHDASAYYNLAVILNKKGKNSEAIQLIRRSLNAVEKDTPSYKNLSEMLERLSQKGPLH